MKVVRKEDTAVRGPRGEPLRFRREGTPLEEWGARAAGPTELRPLTLTGPAENNPPGLNRFFDRPRQQRPFALWGATRAGTPIDQRWRVGLFKQLRATFPATEKDQGVYVEPPCDGDWSGILNIPGIGMNPFGLKPHDPEPFNQLRKEQGKPPLKFWLEAADRELMRRLIKVMIGRELTPRISFNRFSSTGIPFFTKDVAAKQALIHHLSDPGNMRDCFQLAYANRMAELWRRHGVLYAQTVDYRHQWDTAEVTDGADGRLILKPKPRPVFGANHRWGIADKTLSARDVIRTEWTDQLCRDRTRVFQPLDFSVNVLHTLPTYERRAFIKRYPQDLANRCAGAAAIWIGDASNHDQLLPKDIVGLMAERYEELYGPEYAYHARLTAHAPTFEKADVPGGRTVKVAGDPFIPKTFLDQLWYINTSGQQPTDEWAKVGGVFYYVYAAKAAGLLETGSEEELDQVLRGQHHRAQLVNAGDNVLAIFRSLEDRDAWVAANEASPYNNLGEADSIFGLLPWRTGGEVRFVHSIKSLILNRTNPKRSADDEQASDPLAGYSLLKSQFSDHPGSGQALSILDEVTAQAYGRSLSQMALTVPQVGEEGLSAADIETLQRPDAIYWRVYEEDVSPGVLEKLRIVADLPRFERAVAASLKGGDIYRNRRING